MTPRKELFEKVRAALDAIPGIEYVDFDRKQFNKPKEDLPSYFTATLIKINPIKWEAMVEKKQEGKGSVEITLFCKDGWMEQHSKTTDADGGLTEIDLIDCIVESLQGLQGDYFRPLEQTEDEPGDELDEMMSFRVKFDVILYRRLEYKYTKKKLVHTQN